MSRGHSHDPAARATFLPGARVAARWPPAPAGQLGDGTVPAQDHRSQLVDVARDAPCVDVPQSGPRGGFAGVGLAERASAATSTSPDHGSSLPACRNGTVLNVLKIDASYRRRAGNIESQTSVTILYQGTNTVRRGCFTPMVATGIDVSSAELVRYTCGVCGVTAKPLGRSPRERHVSASACPHRAPSAVAQRAGLDLAGIGTCAVPAAATGFCSPTAAPIPASSPGGGPTPDTRAHPGAYPPALPPPYSKTPRAGPAMSELPPRRGAHPRVAPRSGGRAIRHDGKVTMDEHSPERGE